MTNLFLSLIVIRFNRAACPFRLNNHIRIYIFTESALLDQPNIKFVCSLRSLNYSSAGPGYILGCRFLDLCRSGHKCNAWVRPGSVPCALLNYSRAQGLLKCNVACLRSKRSGKHKIVIMNYSCHQCPIKQFILRHVPARLDSRVIVRGKWL